MTREEALEILDRLPTIGEQVDALEMAIEALEKQIPIEPKTNDYGDAICPKCGEVVEWMKFCENCGSAISWGGDAE